MTNHPHMTDRMETGTPGNWYIERNVIDDYWYTMCADSNGVYVVADPGQREPDEDTAYDAGCDWLGADKYVGKARDATSV